MKWLDEILEEVQKEMDESLLKIICPKCKEEVIPYYKEVGPHIGMYCRNNHFIKWVSKETLPKGTIIRKRTKSLF